MALSFLGSIHIAEVFSKIKSLAKVKKTAKTSAETTMPAMVTCYIPSIPHTISDIHSVRTLKPNTRWGKGDKSQFKTIALKDTDIATDLKDINAGKGIMIPPNNDIKAPSCRIYGRHTEKGKTGIFPRGFEQKGFVQLTQAEYGVFQKMMVHGGLKGDAATFFNKTLESGNKGLNNTSFKKLQKLYADWASVQK